MILAGKTPEPGTYDMGGLQSELTIEDWGPNFKMPGTAFTPENIDETRFWGNPPDQPVAVVEQRQARPGVALLPPAAFSSTAALF